MRYKNSNLKIKKNNMVNVLPLQMQELCDKEKGMLEVETQSEKKKSHHVLLNHVVMKSKKIPPKVSQQI